MVGGEFDYYAELKDDHEFTLPNGAAVLAMSGATTGKVAILLKKSNQKYYQNQRVGYFTSTRNVEYSFITTIVRSDLFIEQLKSVLVAGAQPNVSPKDIDSFEFSFPKSKNEQHKIGQIFQSLDRLITLHQREYFFTRTRKNLKPTSKKTNAWEQRKFSEITFPAGEKNKDNLPLESYSITNEAGFVPQDEKFENGGTMREADKRMYYIVTPNSFAYNPARINVGSIGYQNTLKNVIVSSLYEVFKTTDDVNDRLLWHWFKSPDFRKLIEQLQEGGVRLYFYYDKLCMGKVYLPEIDEQGKIGSFFDTLDRLITLHQRELDRLQKIKKSCLEKMFV